MINKLFFKRAKAIVFTILLLIFSSCSTKFYTVSYELGYYNCGKSPDGYLSLDISNFVSSDSTIILRIYNNTDDIILMDTRFFSMSENEVIKLLPFGIEDPNEIKLKSYTFQDNYYSHYNYKKYEDFKISRTITSQSVQQPYLIIPPKKIIGYPIINYIENNLKLIMDSKTIKYKRIYKTDINAVLLELKLMEKNKLNYNLVYKLINEEKWRNCDLTVEPNNIKVFDNKGSEVK